MSRLFNFNPGPCALPDAVMEKAQAEFAEYGNTGASIMELSHRGDIFMREYKRAEGFLRQLLVVPDDYAILFLQGGATGQAAAIPLNLIDDKNRTAAYAVTGHWSKQAAVEGKKYCAVHIAADTAASGYRTLPDRLDIPDDSVYFHYADNETIHGVEFPSSPSSPAPLVCDMSSNIATRPINVSDYGLIYAGAQKNLGPSGVSVVIVQKSLLRPNPDTPMVWDYKKQADDNSMLNTPPTFQIYMVALVLEWMQQEGGMAEFSRRSQDKAQLIYGAIDTSDFYTNNVAANCRSRMNIPFFLADKSLNEDFLRGAEENGMIGLKGHKVLGGCRASLYNAMPMAGAQALSDYMRDFEKRRA